MNTALCTRLAWILMAITFGVPFGRAQGLGDTLNFMMNRSGVYWGGVSVFSGYARSSSTLSAAGPIFNSGLPGQRSFWTYGAATGIGLQRTRLKSNFTLRYSMSYTGIGSYSRFDPLNASLGTSTSHTWNKWTASLSGTVQIISSAEYPFQTSGLGAIAQTPTNFDNIAASFNVGQFNNLQSAGVLAEAALRNAPNFGNLYGGHVLSYYVTPSISYSYSQRWTFHFATASAFGQTRIDGRTTTTPRGLAFSGGVGANYLLSPRTQLGFDVEEQSSFNQYQKAYGTTATVSLGRKMGEHWLLRGFGGTAFGMFTSQVYGKAKRPPIVGGVSAAFQWENHTFLGSFSRSAFDSYGYGAGTSDNMSIAWSWQRPGSWWRTMSQIRRYQVRNTGFSSASGISGSVGFSARLRGNLSASAQFAYLKSDGQYLLVANSFNYTGLRFTLGWSPQRPVEGPHQ